jgi:mRNA interferase RelE/StbE
MTWTLVWTDEARRDLARLDRTVARRILSKLEAAAKDPHRYLKRLKGADDYRLRVGDYRALVLLASGDQRVIVQTVKHRSTVYRDQ